MLVPYHPALASDIESSILYAHLVRTVPKATRWADDLGSKESYSSKPEDQDLSFVVQREAPATIHHDGANLPFLWPAEFLVSGLPP